MAPRLSLHELLKSILGTNQVYFQPPANIRMQYPCIVYSRDFANTEFAVNRPYRHVLRYQVTFIDRNPDNPIKNSIAELPMCVFDRFYVADDLNHDVYKLFF